MRVPDRSGFTLIELVVALVVAGIFTGVIFQLLLGQGRFARLQGAREEVQQNTRAALDIVSNELRAVGEEGITEADDSSITFRVPRAWGLACGDPDLLYGRLAVVFPAGAQLSFRDGDDALAIHVENTTWAFTPVSDVTASTGTDAADDCAAIMPDPANMTEARMFGLSATSIISSLLTDIGAGDNVYVYDLVQYEVAEAPSTGVEGDWLLRGQWDGSEFDMMPVAGPVPEGSGLRFSYADGNGNEILPGELTDQSRRNDIRRIGIKVMTRSRDEFNNVPQTSTDSTVVYLRNRS